MKAFVKATNGVFANVNFYTAWEAFNQMGYSVTCFEEKDIDALDITPATPVFAGVTVFRKIIDKLGVNYPPFDCYPSVLNPYYGRTLRRSTLGEERRKFDTTGVQVFVKPVLPKQFVGHVWNSLINLIPIANVPDDAEVWVCEPIDIVSEFRAYVHDGDILGVKHYWGNWSVTPNDLTIKSIIKQYTGCPIAYGVDFAVINLKTPTGGGLHGDKPGCRLETIVMEVNDGCNLGNYGLDSIHYGEMIVSRWFEIMEQGGKSEELKIEVLKNHAAEMCYKQMVEFTFPPYDDSTEDGTLKK